MFTQDSLVIGCLVAILAVVFLAALAFDILLKKNRGLETENAALKTRVAEFEVQVGPEFRKKMRDKSQQTNFGNQIYNALDGSLPGLVLSYRSEIGSEDDVSYFIQISDPSTTLLVMTIQVSSRSGLHLRMLYVSKTAQYGYGTLTQGNVTSIIKNAKDSATEYFANYAKLSSPHGT